MTTVLTAWACLNCDAAGDGPDSQRAADKHTRTTQHPTRAWTTPVTTQEPNP